MADEFKTYEQAQQWLFFGLPRTSEAVFKGEEGLEKTRKILKEFDNPQNDYKTIHIAGTSGKGTTAKLITDILVQSNKKVGTIMSPHVYDLRERFLVDGQFVEASKVKDTLTSIRKKFTKLGEEGIEPTYFEATLVLAYELFKDYELDYLVVETGLGGLLDGTNLIERSDKLAVITRIGMDHTEVLGNTIEQVARQKAGIITNSISVIALYQKTEVNSVFEEVTSKQKSVLQLVRPEQYLGANPRLMGNHNEGNIALAQAAVEAVAERDEWELENKVYQDVFSNFSLPGRFETKQYGDKEVILDGAHNNQKLRALVSSIEQVYPGIKFAVVFGSSKSRDTKALIDILKPIASEFIFTMYSVNKSDMKRAAQDFTDIEIKDAKTTVINNPEDVISYIEESDFEKWLVTGSFFVVSEIGLLLS